MNLLAIAVAAITEQARWNPHALSASNPQDFYIYRADWHNHQLVAIHTTTSAAIVPWPEQENA